MAKTPPLHPPGRGPQTLQLDCSPLGATAPIRLNRRARHIAVRTKHTAVARLGFEHGLAATTLIKELTCVRGHGLRGPVTAVGTDQGGDQDGQRLLLINRAYPVRPKNRAKAGSRTTSSHPTQADSPRAPNSTTNTGVKQHKAATRLPNTPLTSRARELMVSPPEPWPLCPRPSSPMRPPSTVTK